jgi:hypothetical protein
MSRSLQGLEERQHEKDRLECTPAVVDLGASIDEAMLTATMNLRPNEPALSGFVRRLRLSS